MKHFMAFIMMSTLTVSAHACKDDITRNVQDSCQTFAVNTGLAQNSLNKLTLSDLASIEKQATTAITEFGEIDSCDLYKNDRTKYEKLMDAKAMVSAIQKIRNGASMYFDTDENKSLTPRELFVIAGLLDSNLNVQSRLKCQR